MYMELPLLGDIQHLVLVCGGCLTQVCCQKNGATCCILGCFGKLYNCFKESRGLRICDFYLSAGMCCSGVALWPLIHLLISFCTAALLCNFPWFALVLGCVGCQHHLCREQWKDSASALRGLWLVEVKAS